MQSTGILGQVNNEAAVRREPATPHTELQQSNTIPNLANLMANNPGFSGFAANETVTGGPTLYESATNTPPPMNLNMQPMYPNLDTRPGPIAAFDPMFGGGGFNPETAGMLPSPQQPSPPPQAGTAGFDTNAFSDQILTGVGDLFKEYMGPDGQPTGLPGALPIAQPLPDIGINNPISPMPVRPSPGFGGLPGGGMFPGFGPGIGSVGPGTGILELLGLQPQDLQQIAQKQEVPDPNNQVFTGGQPGEQPDAYNYAAPMGGPQAQYNNSSGIQSAFRGLDN
tara:strand:- start:12 stop:854 length:843 start_codon:yes stop_codon:yes gene_type:complete